MSSDHVSVLSTVLSTIPGLLSPLVAACVGAAVAYLHVTLVVGRQAAAVDTVLEQHLGMGRAELIDDEVRSLVRTGRTDEAFRLYRDYAHVGLRKARRHIAGPERGL
jgi:hypothetical protein